MKGCQFGGETWRTPTTINSSTTLIFTATMKHAARAYGPEARHFADTPALLAALGDSSAGEPAFGSPCIR